MSNITLILVALLAAVPCLAQSRLRAGVFVADISPQPGMGPLVRVGSFEPQKGENLNDPLSARAVVLDDGRTRVAIVLVDSVGVPADIFDEAKKLAAGAAGIPATNMLMAATHSHSAPSANIPAYRKLLVTQIAEAVKQASSRLQPAEIGGSSGHVPEHLFNRRWYMREGSIKPSPLGDTGENVQMNPPRGSPDLIRPAGPTDPQVSVVSVRTAAGKPLALLANYSLHYVGYVPAHDWSADYFGEFARQIQERLLPGDAGSDFLGILSNGTSGDVNNINWSANEPELKPYEKIRIVAARVADAAFGAYKNIKHQGQFDLAIVEREITLTMRKPTEAQLRYARETLAAPDAKDRHIRARHYAEGAIRIAEGPETVRIKLQALRIGELAITAIPFEVFTETGLEIKKRSPFQRTFTIELANGSFGYLPTPEQHALGGYETWLGTNRVEVNASRIITETLMDMLAEISRRGKQ